MDPLSEPMSEDPGPVPVSMPVPDPASAESLPAPADDRSAALRGVTRRYPTPMGDVVALDDVSLDVPAAGLTVVTGLAGSGKSTLVRILACVERADGGDVWLAGADANALSHKARRELRRASIGVLLQRPADNLLPGLDTGANLVWAARRRTRSVLNQSGVEAHLEMVGLGGSARKRVGQLTGAEQQRLALACAFAGNPRLVVADEPTAALDRDGALRLVNAFRDAADSGIAVVAATQDELLVGVADSVVELSYGRRIA